MTTIVLVGRTNVGKSTLFNRIVGRRAAIVHDRPGVTRDRKEAPAAFRDLNFKIVDTAGLEATTALAAAMWDQTQRAIAEGDVVVMVVDARAEITPLDSRLASDLRALEKPVVLVANKCEGAAQSSQLAEFYQFGLGDPIAVSAEHNLGLEELYLALKAHVRSVAAAEAAAAEEPAARPLKLAIVGRPNVGKSTLINKLLKQDRLLTGPEAGVTRDAITIPWEWRGKPVLLT
ncbi:MAG: 50S ribosome-binding GTPase, partial [Alphaproteobacteria bacterium]|nr:50S ribosome-binding GTPase [Alphaproteobacteria bacterium]